MACKQATVREGLQEDRTRVTIFLPSHNYDDIRAVRLVVKYLCAQRKSKTGRVTGFTSSRYPDSPFSGIWWSPHQRKWVPEKVTLIIMDYLERLGDERLENALRRLKQAIHDSYKSFSREQEVIWIIATPVMRFA